MGAIPEKKSEKRKPASNVKTMVMVVGIIGGIAALGLGYMFIFVQPEIVEERVEVIAVTESGCIVETFDGFSVNVGQCDAQPGDFLMAPIDQKVKERALAMNPS